MLFHGITTTEAVRGALGVEPEELPDKVFTDTMFETELKVDIEGWLPQTIAEVCAGASAGTTGYEDRLNLLKLHAQYAGAVILFPHLNLGISQETTDGQNAFKRKEDAVKSAVKEAHARAEKFKTLLLGQYATQTTAPPDLFGSARPTYDPVTGEDS